MAIHFRCQACGHKLKADASLAGRRVACTRCHDVQTVPAPALAEEPLKFRRDPPPADEWDMTPMIDVVFLLLIFFMVTAAFSLQKAIELPEAEEQAAASTLPTLEELEQDTDYVIVEIDKDNMIWVDDLPAPSQQELLSRLRMIRRGRDVGGRGPRRLLVVASGMARHEQVVQVLDAGMEVGMDDIRLASADDAL